MCIYWNGLPKNIRISKTLLQFKNELKTHYFKEAFPKNDSDSDSDIENFDY